jgi:hypothetical protein
MIPPLQASELIIKINDRSEGVGLYSVVWQLQIATTGVINAKNINSPIINNISCP